LDGERMGNEKVVSINKGKDESSAKEYAVLFRLIGNDVQFKLFGEAQRMIDKKELADAFKAAARKLESDYF
jgi:hypothetical protein